MTTTALLYLALAIVLSLLALSAAAPDDPANRFDFDDEILAFLRPSMPASMGFRPAG